MRTLKTQLAVLLLSTLGLFTGAYGQVIPSVDAATLNQGRPSGGPYPAFTAQARAQGRPFSGLSRPPNAQAKTGNTDGAEMANADSHYTYSVLYSFCSAPNCTDGALPAGLIEDAAGNLYGTTSYGGANVGADNGYGGGTVFKVDNTGHETVLYSFCSEGGANCTDGDMPTAGLIQDDKGNLYGTTFFGGAGANHGFEGGGGTVFKLDKRGHETVLHNFCSKGDQNCTDGAYPEAGLIRDAAGNLYGTTEFGGANIGADDGYGGGTVFKVDNTGHETVLYSFCSEGGANCTDGDMPTSVLIQDAAGNLYGTTSQGGAGGEYCMQNDGSEGPCGTVFKVDATGHETVLYSFCSEGGANCTDGAFPSAGLIEDAAGNLYGTTRIGGANGPYDGTVFKLEPPAQPGLTWTETVLYSFCSEGGANCTDGRLPESGLIQDSAGNLYGTTAVGGANVGVGYGGYGGGTAFKLEPPAQPGGNWTETVLYSFCSQGGANCTDGASPEAGLIQDAAGNLYGTTDLTVFKLAGATKGASAAITLTSSPNPSTVDQPVEFSVVVSGNGAMPIGSVTFEQGKAVLGTVTLVDGQAGLITTFTKSDKFSIVASYSGDLNYRASKTKPFEQVVEK
jgi:uncharacterized repeat protein (TIGR03803 family)